MKKVEEKSIAFVNESIFGDKIEHLYDVECLDGYAIAQLADTNDHNAPKNLRITYPHMEYVMAYDDLCDDILRYRGLYDKEKSDIHYGDIMLYCGIIERCFICGDTIISRDDYECMPSAMNTSSLTDDDMQRLAEAIDTEMGRWKEWLDNGDISQDKYDQQWWKVFEECGLNFGMTYEDSLWIKKNI